MKNPNDFEFSFKGYSVHPLNLNLTQEYVGLLKNSFAKFSPTVEYLEWLYRNNPRGNAVGFDAFDGTKLIAHYACIPIKLDGYSKNTLLSLNTATDPNYQGRGLFVQLAKQTFEFYGEDFSNVVGVANSKSTGGFLKHLGFSGMGNLELRYGDLNRDQIGSKIYTEQELDWRISCPSKPLSARRLGSNMVLVESKFVTLGPSLKSIVFIKSEDNSHRQRKTVGLTLDWRRGNIPSLKLPEKFKPSPLNLIFKPLQDLELDVLSSFSFPDFDAF
jgi:hypothetical protein